ncbi:hypothetical protein D3C72_1654230 [compost metagenome]
MAGLVSQHVAQQVRRRVEYCRLFKPARRAGNVPIDTHDVVQSRKATQMGVNLRQHVERGQFGGALALVDGQILADLALPDHLAILQRQLPGNEQQICRLADRGIAA